MQNTRENDLNHNQTETLVKLHGNRLNTLSHSHIPLMKEGITLFTAEVTCALSSTTSTCEVNQKYYTRLEYYKCFV